MKLLQSIALALKEGTTVTVSNKSATLLWEWIIRKGGTKVRKGLCSINGWEIEFVPSTRKHYMRVSAKQVEVPA